MESLSSLPPLNIAIVVLAGIGALYIIFKVGSKIIKTIGLVLIVALAIFFWQGGTVDELKLKGIGALFGDTHISDMEAKFCKDDKAQGSMCTCVVQPVIQDLQANYSRSELESLDLNKQKRKEAIRKSMGNRQSEIFSCLKDRGVDNVKDLAESLR